MEENKVFKAKLIVNTCDNGMYGWSECGYCGYVLRSSDSTTECKECGALFEDIKHEPYSFGGSDF